MARTKANAKHGRQREPEPAIKSHDLTWTGVACAILCVFRLFYSYKMSFTRSGTDSSERAKSNATADTTPGVFLVGADGASVFEPTNTGMYDARMVAVDGQGKTATILQWRFKVRGRGVGCGLPGSVPACCDHVTQHAPF
jgi:hypothetical protein